MRGWISFDPRSRVANSLAAFGMLRPAIDVLWSRSDLIALRQAATALRTIAGADGPVPVCRFDRMAELVSAARLVVVAHDAGAWPALRGRPDGRPADDLTAPMGWGLHAMRPRLVRAGQGEALDRAIQAFDAAVDRAARSYSPACLDRGADRAFNAIWPMLGQFLAQPDRQAHAGTIPPVVMPVGKVLPFGVMS